MNRWVKLTSGFAAYHYAFEARPDAPPTDWRGKGRSLNSVRCDVCKLHLIAITTATGGAVLWNGRGGAVCGYGGAPGMPHA